MTIKVADVYRGESVRVDNGSQDGLPIFGRFAAIVRCADVRACGGDGAEWFALAPFGVCFGHGTREEATEAARGFADRNTHGWSTDREAARLAAIEAAKQRHNAACRRGTYRAKYGEPV